MYDPLHDQPEYAWPQLFVDQSFLMFESEKQLDLIMDHFTPWLIDFLVEKNAFNIHMGLSPYYRGTSCNFWALYDENPAYVGATIHMLSKGLDSGDMLFHCVPNLEKNDTPFDFTMRSVAVAFKGLVGAIEGEQIFSMSRIKQDKSQEIRYTKNSEFTDLIAKEFMDRKLDLHTQDFDYPNLLNPIFS